VLNFLIIAHRNRPRISITIATSIIPPRQRDTRAAARIRIASDPVRTVETMATVNQRSPGTKNTQLAVVHTPTHIHNSTGTHTQQHSKDWVLLFQ